MTDARESTGMERGCAFVLPLCQKTKQTVAWPVVADKGGERGIIGGEGRRDRFEWEALGCMGKLRRVMDLELYLLLLFF